MQNANVNALLETQLTQANELMTAIMTTISHYETNEGRLGDETIDELMPLMTNDVKTQLNECLQNTSILLQMSDTALNELLACYSKN